MPDSDVERQEPVTPQPVSPTPEPSSPKPIISRRARLWGWLRAIAPMLVKMLVLSILWIAPLAFVIHFFFPELLPSCIRAWASSISLALIIVGFGHLFWLGYGQAVQRAARGAKPIKTSIVEVDVGVVAEMANESQPAFLPPWLRALVALLLMAIGALGLTPLSFQVEEEPPIIRHFLVNQPDDDTTTTVKLAGLMPLGLVERVWVTAVVNDPSGIVCEWGSLYGALDKGDGCSTWYTAPTAEHRDALTVETISPCRTQRATGSLIFNVGGVQSP